MNMHNPPKPGGNGAEPGRKRPRRTPKGRQLDVAAHERGARAAGRRASAGAIC